MIYLYVVLGVAGIAVIAVFAVAFVCYMRAFYQKPHKKQDHFRLPDGKHFDTNHDKMFALIAEMEAVPFEQVYTRSFDGLTLAARYFEISKNAPLQIQFHGYRGTAIRDFCGGNKLARKMGFNTLLVDMRAHGKSGGHTITFGVRERRDVLCWIDYALKRFGTETEIWLVGVSMGAATVLMASELNLPPNVKGIVADSPYAVPSDIIADTCRKMHLKPQLMMPFIRLGARLFGGFGVDSASALRAVEKTNLPVLLIHGEDDDIVPCEMSQAIAAHCSRVTLALFPNAGHGLSYMADNQRYERTVMEFIEANTSDEQPKKSQNL